MLKWFLSVLVSDKIPQDVDEAEESLEKIDNENMENEDFVEALNQEGYPEEWMDDFENER